MKVKFAEPNGYFGYFNCLIKTFFYVPYVFILKNSLTVA